MQAGNIYSPAHLREDFVEQLGHLERPLVGHILGTE